MAEQETYSKDEVMEMLKFIKGEGDWEGRSHRLDRIAKELGGTGDEEAHSIYLTHLRQAQNEVAQRDIDRGQDALRQEYIRERDLAVEKWGRGSQAVRNTINKYRKLGLRDV